MDGIPEKIKKERNKTIINWIMFIIIQAFFLIGLIIVGFNIPPYAERLYASTDQMFWIAILSIYLVINFGIIKKKE